MSEICFAWDRGVTGKWGCKALTSVCDGQDEKCPFFKTKEQHEQDKDQSFRRIATLPAMQRRAISDMYYRGEKPWAKYVVDEEDDAIQGDEAASVRPVYADNNRNGQVKSYKATGDINDLWKQVMSTLQMEVAGNA